MKLWKSRELLPTSYFTTTLDEKEANKEFPYPWLSHFLERSSFWDIETLYILHVHSWSLLRPDCSYSHISSGISLVWLYWRTERFGHLKECCRWANVPVSISVWHYFQSWLKLIKTTYFVINFCYSRLLIEKRELNKLHCTLLILLI